LSWDLPGITTTNKFIVYQKEALGVFMLLVLIFVEIAFGRLIPDADRDDAR
jgi:hypothetical protein